MKISGGKSESAKEFCNSINEAMYRNFVEEGLLDKFLLELQSSLIEGSPKYKLVSELIAEKKKLCYTFTGKMFICSNGSASRGESMMNRLKGNSTIKAKMRDWNLYDWYNHYDILFKNYITTTRDKIQKVILNGNGWCSRFVFWTG